MLLVGAISGEQIYEPIDSVLTKLFPEYRDKGVLDETVRTFACLTRPVILLTLSGATRRTSWPGPAPRDARTDSICLKTRPEGRSSTWVPNP